MIHIITSHGGSLFLAGHQPAAASYTVILSFSLLSAITPIFPYSLLSECFYSWVLTGKSVEIYIFFAVPRVTSYSKFIPYHSDTSRCNSRSQWTVVTHTRQRACLKIQLAHSPRTNTPLSISGATAQGGIWTLACLRLQKKSRPLLS